MAGPILQKSLPKEPNKTELNLDPEIYWNDRGNQSPVITAPTHTLDGLRPMIEAAKIYCLPGIAGYFVSILEETVLNLTRLHEDLSKIEKMLVKGGAQ